MLHLKFFPNLSPSGAWWMMKKSFFSLFLFVLEFRNPCLVILYISFEQSLKHHLLQKDPSIWYTNYHRYSFWEVELRRMLIHCSSWLWKDFFWRPKLWCLFVEKWECCSELLRGTREEKIIKRKTILLLRRILCFLIYFIFVAWFTNNKIFPFYKLQGRVLHT